MTIEEYIKKLQEPFDEKYRDTKKAGLASVYQFPDAVYEQRLDDVFGLNWDYEIKGGGYRIAARVPTADQTIVREGSTFIDACVKFGVGRYLLLQENEQE